jgi:hypothetical protein
MSFGDRVMALSQYVRAGYDPSEAAEKLGLPVVRHTGRLPVTVQKPEDQVPVPKADSADGKR